MSTENQHIAQEYQSSQDVSRNLGFGVPFDQDKHDAVSRPFDAADNVISLEDARRVKEEVTVPIRPASTFDVTKQPEYVDPDPISVAEAAAFKLPKEPGVIGKLVNKALFGVEDPAKTKAHRLDISRDSVAVHAAKRRQHITKRARF